MQLTFCCALAGRTESARPKHYAQRKVQNSLFILNILLPHYYPYYVSWIRLPVFHDSLLVNLFIMRAAASDDGRWAQSSLGNSQIIGDVLKQACGAARGDPPDRMRAGG